MTETRTNRFDIPQWSSGSDSGSRADFNEALIKLNDKAAYDDGVTQSALPGTNLIPGRYQLVTHDGTYRVVYRRHDGGGWDAVGGNTMPNPFHFRGIAAGVARTDAAVTFSHPDATNVGGTIGYDGSAVLSGTVRVFDDDETGRGALLVGTSAAPNLTTLGRAHIRTQAINERALTVQAHASNAGNLLTARTAGDSDVLSVDALGRLRALAPSAFGGAPLPTLASLAIAPTASDDDDTTAGLLLHGSTGSAEITAKAIMRILRDAADPAPLAEFLRDGISIGRLPWTGATMTFASNTHHFRVSGNVANTTYWQLRRSDPTSSLTEANAALDTTLISVTPNGMTSGLPMVVSQRQKQNLATMSVHRVGDFNANFLDLGRLTPDGGGGETLTTVSSWHADGRLRTGAPWRSMGTMRDARQSITHLCTKRFTPLSEPANTGQFIARGTSFDYTWPAMTCRSVDTTDLDISTIVEFLFTQNPDGIDDSNSVSVSTYISVNSGSYTFIETWENVPVSTSLVHRQSGDLMYVNHRASAVPAGATFQLRTRVTVGSVGPNSPQVYLRTLDVKAVESIVETYSPLP